MAKAAPLVSTRGAVRKSKPTKPRWRTAFEKADLAERRRMDKMVSELHEATIVREREQPTLSTVQDVILALGGIHAVREWTGGGNISTVDSVTTWLRHGYVTRG